jgi:FAD/FMN-containing dehydrogenase
MNPNLLEALKKEVTGEVLVDEETLMTHSHDASLFEVKPQAVVFPKTEADVQNLVKFVAEHKKEDPTLSITGRAAGTDMSGGSVNTSIIAAFSKYFNKTPTVNGDIVTTQPGVFYRDFEAETLKTNMIFPSYPASRELCAMGGIVNNNSGGEKSLQYGKTERYVKRVKVVLRDGNTYEFKPLTEAELKEKMELKTLEGEIYTKMYKLITDNYDAIMKAKPPVSKNSAGYFLWNIYDKEKGTFDLTQLWVGAQGTLGMLVEADIKVVPIHKHREMMVIFLHDLAHLGEIINLVLPSGPESFESYDDNTLKLALKFFPEFAKSLGTKGFIQTGIDFLPEFIMVILGGLPKLVLQIDFTGDDQKELADKIAALKEKLKPLHPKMRIALEDDEKKYWAIRRESFNLLRKKIHDKHTAPFIDDFVVPPKYLAEFLPQVNTLFKHYPSLVYTVAGHVGDGNFHIIPLMDITKQEQRDIIPELGKKVYDLVLKYEGSITGEHNDGYIRTPYLEQMYGKEIVTLFEETKKIFDPENIFNPGKKVNGSLDFAMSHIRQNW